MNHHQTPYGQLHILNLEDIFEKTIQTIESIAANKKGSIIIALTGGSTPKAFYKWVAENNTLSPALLERIIWTTSDERCVPLESDDSNFGNADRLMLAPLNVTDKNKLPWTVNEDPSAAADAMNAHFQTQSIDLCLLGMGDDCHTASLFPSSPLLEKSTENFAAIDVPGKGSRLTLTPKGFDICDNIIITVTGIGKNQALHQVLDSEHNPSLKPSQILKDHANKTTWLADTAAASKLQYQPAS